MFRSVIKYLSVNILNTLFKILALLSLILKILQVKEWERKAPVFEELKPKCSCVNVWTHFMKSVKFPSCWATTFMTSAALVWSWPRSVWRLKQRWSRKSDHLRVTCSYHDAHKRQLETLDVRIFNCAHLTFIHSRTVCGQTLSSPPVVFYITHLNSEGIKWLFIFESLFTWFMAWNWEIAFLFYWVLHK